MSDSKKEKTLERINTVPNIDVNVDVSIPRAVHQFDERIHNFKCSACGKGFTKQETNFQRTNDVLFQCNNGYLPWCKECTDRYVAQMTALYSNNEELAMKDFCQRAGWNYDINALVASKETYSKHRDRTRISHYAAKKNINCGGRKTYIETLKYEFQTKENEVITSKEQAKENETAVKNASIDRWGIGLTALDYKILDEHYKLIKNNNPNVDNNQETFIKTLCNVNMLALRAVREGRSDDYIKLTTQYAKIFKEAGLRAIEEKDSSNDNTFGVTLAIISQYTPEEFYKDKKLYGDWDELDDYMERHIRRPIENILSGTDVRDKEFFVPDTDEGDN